MRLLEPFASKIPLVSRTVALVCGRITHISGPIAFICRRVPSRCGKVALTTNPITGITHHVTLVCSTIALVADLVPLIALVVSRRCCLVALVTDPVAPVCDIVTLVTDPVPPVGHFVTFVGEATAIRLGSARARTVLRQESLLALTTCAFTAIVGQSATGFCFPTFVSGHDPFVPSKRTVVGQIADTKGLGAFLSRVAAVYL